LYHQPKVNKVSGWRWGLVKIQGRDRIAGELGVQSKIGEKKTNKCPLLRAGKVRPQSAPSVNNAIHDITDKHQREPFGCN
jgi:hypothetical protein